MLHRYLIVLGLTICAAMLSTAQVHGQTGQATYIMVPGENVLLLIAAQPSAPVRFEEPSLLMSSDGRELQVSFGLHNVGKKPIRYVTPVIWTSFGTGGTVRSNLISGTLQPGDIVRNGSIRQVVNLSPESRERLKLKTPMKALIVLLVEGVTFEDGSTYSDRSTSTALLSYFEDLSDKMERLENIDRVGAKRMHR